MPLESFPIFNGDNMGGTVRQFLFISIDDVEFEPKPVNGNISIDIQLKAGKAWLSCPAIYETGNLSELQETGGNDPDYYMHRFTGWIPMWNPKVSSLLNEMQHHRFLCLVQDKQGQWILVGSTRSEGLKFTSNSTTGTTAANRNGYEFEFYGKCDNRAPFYQANYTIVYPDSDPGTVVIKDADGTTLQTVSVPSGGSITVTLLQIIRERVTIDAGDTYEDIVYGNPNNADTEYSTHTLTNADSATYIKDPDGTATPVTFPFTLSPGDVLRVTIVPTNPALDSEVYINGQEQ